MIKVGVLGSTGRMGQAILEALKNHPRCALGLAGMRENGEALFAASDVAIDFTAPELLSNHIDLSLRHNKPLVVGTTGLQPDHHLLLSSASTQIPLVVSANMSMGVALLTSFVKKASSFLDESYDIEIDEFHHRYKKDAPSGTALALGQAAAKGRGKSLNEVISDPNRQGERLKGSIGFAVHRGGMVIGDHAVRFIGDDEMLEFSHRALSRNLYAKGALKAAEWVAKQKKGLYSMGDVLGF